MTTNREAHEEAAGMGLCEEFFKLNNLDPNAPYGGDMTEQNNCVCGHSRNHHNGRWQEPQVCHHPGCDCGDYEAALKTSQTEAGMSTELERVRQELVDLAGETRAADFERLVREEVQRQTVEAVLDEIGRNSIINLNEWAEPPHQVRRRIRALLSPAQEVRNG